MTIENSTLHARTGIETPNGATLKDLSDFVSTAGRLGIDPETVVRVRVGFKSQIRKLEVEKKSDA